MFLVIDLVIQIHLVYSMKAKFSVGAAPRGRTTRVPAVTS